MVEKVILEFDKYVSNFDKSNNNVSLKYNHSFSVMNLIAELAFRLNLDKEKLELAKIIGLLHDIGRFEQIKKFNLMSDGRTGFDHADYGADYLFKEGHIRDFLDTDKYDKIIETSIRYHNKLNIPDNLADDELLFVKMIRDMDKVDIFKVISVHESNQFDAKEITENVLKEFKEEKPINNKNIKTDSDRTLRTLAFVFDINFNESFDILVEEDNFDLFLSTVLVSEDSENLWKKVREVCFDKINRGV